MEWGHLVLMAYVLISAITFLAVAGQHRFGCVS